MPPDIRSFFGRKDGGGTPAKPAAKKDEDTSAKKSRNRSRKVVEESDDDDDVVLEKKKPSKRSTPRKKKSEPELVKGVEVSASEYFASSKSSQPSKSEAGPAKGQSKTLPRSEVEIRVSPHKKEPAHTASPEQAKKGRAGGTPTTKKRATTAYKAHDFGNGDEDAFLDDGNDDDDDDIFAADAKRGKRKNDDYAEDNSDDDEILRPRAKRVASRSDHKPAIVVESSDDEDEDEDDFVSAPAARKAAAGGAKTAKAGTGLAAKKATGGNRTPSTASRKRKTPDPEFSDVDVSPVSKPRKKPATGSAGPKPKAAPATTKTIPKTTKTADGDVSTVQAIIDTIPTIEPPPPPPKDGNAPKFDWRKAAAGGGNAGPPPNAGASELPNGAPNCLAGQTFVFTGLLKTISREEGQALVKRHGGKVTSAPSKNTGWVVLGDDAGPSKLAKIQQFGIRTIDENGLFELIRRMPAGGGDSKEAEKARKAQEREDERIRQAVEEMQQDEENRLLEAEEAHKVATTKSAARAPSGIAKGVGTGTSSHLNNGAAASSQQSTASGSAPPPRLPQQLWTTKYAPKNLGQICGNKAQVERIASWLKNWPKAKKYDFKARGADGLGASRAIIISGPPGIGKTTAAHLAASLADHDVIESNASDTRSKKLVEDSIGDTMDNTSLLGYFAADGKPLNAEKKNVVLIMDEVDGMSAGDRGGIGALAKLCRKTEVPLILICNERRLPKMRPFDHVAFDIRFNRPTVDQIRSRMMTICHREGLKLPPQVVDALIEGTNKDIRQIINMLSTAKLDQTSMTYDQGKAMTKAWEKHVVLKPWDICQKMLGGGLFAPTSKATLNDKIELYFNDHEFSYLMIQENYLNTRPMALTSGPNSHSKRQANLKYLELVDNAAESISDGDLVDRMIHGPQQQWSLMPTHAVFSTVRPASFVAGQLTHSGFTSWLGNNSKLGKLSRFVREIHSHMRLRASGDHNEVRQQYLPVLWHQLIKRMEMEGKEVVDDVIALMDSYYLTRDDLDAIKELGVGPQAEETVNIDSQTKATFTRTYNGMPHPVPFLKASTVTATKKMAREMPDLEEAIEEEDEGDVLAEPVEADSDDMDLKKDKYIKQPKASKAKRAAPKKAAAAKSAAAAAKDGDDGDDDDGGDVGASKKPRGKGKAAATKKGGKAKK
ncbi:DNA replication factor c subunit [Niveomyces insectorum RCEF 264]|uniref:Replication factor C subunit 1 n=1 Tax=Niveomyces insectorum RCEF 264 TaxID=1081102 RepID=A0A167Z6Z7_9HYPO|nr:DNA replication factor c subunit [Niveomyces insectorum RCEF 264]